MSNFNDLRDRGLGGIVLEKGDPETLFQITGTLGRGSFGTVYVGRNRSTGETVAIKQIMLANETEMFSVTKEIAILQECSQENIVKYRGTYRSLNALWITMEFCAGGSVDKILARLQTPLTEPQISYICREVLKGLVYLHSRHTIHRDIKSGNILLTDDGGVKLADFGVSAQLMDTMCRRNSFIGTVYWMAPEAIQEKDYDVRADMWSLGITVIEMAELAPPRIGMHMTRALLMIPKEPPPVLKHQESWSPAMHRFVARCLTKDPTMRPSAQEMLDDPFVSPPLGSAKDIVSLIAQFRAAPEHPEGGATSGGGTQVDNGPPASAAHQAISVSAAASPQDAAARKKSVQQLMDVGMLLPQPFLHLDDFTLDEIAPAEPVPLERAVRLLAGQDDPTVSVSMPPLLHATVSLMNSFVYHQEVVYANGVTREEDERSRALATKYGSVLKTMLRI